VKPQTDKKAKTPNSSEKKRLSSMKDVSPPKKKRKSTTNEDSDSELSVLNDATPPQSKHRKPVIKSGSPQPKSKVIEKSRATNQAAPADDEMKHLKSLVFKCGVRKNWSKELPPAMSHSQQLSHVKNLLNSLGMKGKFTAGKAKRIKEERELHDELSFIQETTRSIGEGKRRRS
jgi:hypothetical protein